MASGYGLYWDDVELGMAAASPGRTVTEADVVAFAGLSGDYCIDWKFTGPIHLGDTIHLEFEVVERRETSKPGRGIVKLARRLHTHEGVVVQEGTTTLMLERRP